MNKDHASLAALWVCWKKPQASLCGDAPVLSFLSPASEEELEYEYRGVVIRAREISLAVRSKARELYINTVARFGLVQCGGGLTLRQALSRPGEASLWWYHPVAFKDCEADPIFDWIIAVLTIRTVAEKQGLKNLVLFGAPCEVAAVIKSVFATEERDTRRSGRVWWNWLHALASRARYAVTTLRQWRAIRRRKEVSKGVLDVVFSGFWDWSVWWDGQAQSLADRYFKCLPNEVSRHGVSSIGWFAWLDPHSEPGEEKRRLKEVLAPLSDRKDGVILQSFLRPWDILKAVGDFRPLARFLKVRKRSAFKEVFQNDGIDYYPLFSQVLLRGFLDASLLHGDLVALATERACRRHRPKVALSFLEHFPHSRAHYEGVRRAGVDTACVAVQHASYSHEKTFLFLHPSLEYKGEPDGFAVPHPDYVCVMGTLGQELFLECGYPRERVLLTGSPRYDHVTDRCNGKHTRSARGNEKLHLLMVSTLHLDLEMEMIEAVCNAARDVNGFKLLFRNHPFRRIQQHPRFAEFKDQIQVTQGLLEEDLDRADLVLFTYSTVAEEAFVRGKPVWQWLPLGFNGSALVEAVAVPQFNSVASLRDALRALRADRHRFLPSPETRKLALQRLFFLGDGMSAARVAGVVDGLLAEGGGDSLHCSLPGAGSLVPIL